ncbi:ribosome small subunit-dependent GTPase A [Paraferrimonas haliotis]|uniref:ribosome small subunit-dependent GTPase A n=1 Tax=Paraferrimonas haliotis TaxID=2013866 RepID=UPI000BA99C61|nr:ribosome small subunit-dependent GTPase A [Paraferrimonas haliotis]
MTKITNLSQLGWRPFFQQQLSLTDYDESVPARVVEQHRNQLVLRGESGEIVLALHPSMPALCVGDWVLLDKQHQFVRLLERYSEFSRKAAGSGLEKQLIATNLDAVFVVMSLNQDFKLSRLERYLTLVNETGAQAVIVLTKRDLCDDVDSLQAQVQALDPLLQVIAVNGLDSESIAPLRDWCKEGQTVAFMGSSGVGKSTLINSLQGQQLLATSGIREDDSKGRHTTTTRSLHLMPGSGLLMDTPGMRELQLADVETGLSTTFAEIEALAKQCRFNNCSHQSEPGCSVQAALANGELDQRRLSNYFKLAREQALNSASLAQKRAKDKALGKMYRTVQGESQRRKKGY